MTVPGVEATLEIESIAAGGDGVGRIDRQVVFVPRTAPGDVARIRYVANGRFARGVLLGLDRSSPERVVPACGHYVVDRCGGCQLQHITIAGQHEAKSRIVRDAFARIGRRPIDAPAVRSSPRAWRYRRKLTLTLRPTGADGAWMAGLHRWDTPDEVFPLRDCRITDEGVLGVWREILAAAHALPSAPELRGAVQETPAGYAFVLEGGDAWPLAEAFRAAVPSVDACWWVPRGRARRPLAPVARAPGSGAAFAQVNAEVGEMLHAYVVDRALRYAPATAVDAYAGTGATAALLAERGVRVTAIEADRDAAAVARERLPRGARVEVGRVEDILGAVPPADVVLLNPPRGGLAATVTAMLGRMLPAPRAILYVSCDPATLARDVARLPGYRVARVDCFDMFPQTAHVETVCELVPADSTAS